MTNFIVPIDFSETSKNAARYAAHISHLVPDSHLILYNVFDALEYGSDSSPLATDKEEDAGRKAIMELALESVRSDISAITSAKISCVAEENDHFVNTLENYVRNKNIQLIIMGITGSTRLGKIFMGSNTLKIVNRRIAPVIIVPPDTKSTSAKNIVLLTDLDDVENTIPIDSIGEDRIEFIQAEPACGQRGQRALCGTDRRIQGGKEQTGKNAQRLQP